MWIVVGLGVVAAVAAAIGWSQGRGRGRDLGGMSNLWLAEHRHSQTQDPRR
jgi:hypothetical protein